MAEFKRKKLFIDSQVQGVLVRRALIYLVACGLFMLLPILIGRAIADPQHLFFENLGPFFRKYGMFFTCILLMLPLMVYDILKLTNRFAGPVFRLRREMRKLAEGQKVYPLKFRDGDYWTDITLAFNAIVQRMETLEQYYREHEETEQTDELVKS
jgi:hypothetical protein